MERIDIFNKYFNFL